MSKTTFSPCPRCGTAVECFVSSQDKCRRVLCKQCGVMSKMKATTYLAAIREWNKTCRLEKAMSTQPEIVTDPATGERYEVVPQTTASCCGCAGNESVSLCVHLRSARPCLAVRDGRELRSFVIFRRVATENKE
jgi:transcription elongation factor Elf1